LLFGNRKETSYRRICITKGSERSPSRCRDSQTGK